MRTNQTFKAYNASVFAITRILLPAWVVHYYVKYHVDVSAYLLGHTEHNLNIFFLKHNSFN